MVLNTLAVDPKRVWKGPWRWYNESMLDCCRSLEEIKESGIEFDQFSCLGRCNSLTMLAKRPTQRHIYPTKQTKEPIIEDNEDKNDQENENNSNNNNNNKNEDIDPMMINPLKKKYFTIDEFREDVKVACASSNDPVLIVSYSRKGLKQTGDGHFSPIAGYHVDKDMCLIMDVARFKYPPHWVKTQVLYDAMCRIDKSCNKTRGWIMASPAELAKSYYFTFNTAVITEKNVIDINDGLCCCGSRFIHVLDDKESKQHISSGCSMHNDLTSFKVIHCLLGCLPVPMNKYIAVQTEKFGIELEETHQIIKDKLINGIQNTGVHQIVIKIFNDKNNTKLIERFGKCLNQIEVITLMVLIIGNKDCWQKIANDKIKQELKELTKIDKNKYPELYHEVTALQHQMKHLRQYLLSLYSHHFVNNSEHNCNC